ncbi:hypothetical protein [Gloeothece verrucosa]|uniref:hypothetical protein n=1 Tax=Gloeothece verrucosa TaxID=2546359 RepID=UPI00017E2D9C|nr:hypothetical protein [Gloeothece verrucosa]
MFYSSITEPGHSQCPFCTPRPLRCWAKKSWALYSRSFSEFNESRKTSRTRDDPRKILFKKIEAFISQDLVSVYFFEDGTAKNVLDENGYINWVTCGKVSDDLSQNFV